MHTLNGLKPPKSNNFGKCLWLAVSLVHKGTVAVTIEVTNFGKVKINLHLDS